MSRLPLLLVAVPLLLAATMAAGALFLDAAPRETGTPELVAGQPVALGATDRLREAHVTHLLLTPDVTGMATPTGLYVVADANTLQAFADRSPHMGCLLEWQDGWGTFYDTCHSYRWRTDGSPVAHARPAMTPLAVIDKAGTAYLLW